MGGQGKTINRKRKFVGRKADDPEFDLDKKHFKVLHLNASEKRLIIVLEGAQLETVKVYIYIFNLNDINQQCFAYRCTTHSSCSTVTIMRALCAKINEIRAAAARTSHTNAC